MKQVKIYTTDFCPYCDRVKSLFMKMEVPYVEVNITEDANTWARLTEKTGFRTVPQVFIGDKFCGGCDDFYALERADKLDSLLAD